MILLKNHLTKKINEFISKNLELLKNKLTIDNYRNKLSFHTKINFIGSSKEISNYLEKINKFKNKENIFISFILNLVSFFS